MKFLALLSQSGLSQYAKDALTKKIPLYIAIIALLAGAAGCGMLFEKPSLDILPRQTAEIKKVIELSNNSREAAQIFKGQLEAYSAIDSPSIENKEKIKEAYQVYLEAKENNIKLLFAYLALNVKEIKAILEVSHGELDEDYKKIVEDVIEQLK